MNMLKVFEHTYVNTCVYIHKYVFMYIYHIFSVNTYACLCLHTL